MCRLVWQLLGMLGNVLGLLDMLRNVLGMLCNVLGMFGNILGLLGMPFRKVLGVLHRRKKPPLEAWWYITPLTSQLINVGT